MRPPLVTTLGTCARPGHGSGDVRTPRSRLWERGTRDAGRGTHSTLPFLGVLLATGSQWLFVDLLAFAAGLVTPATLFVLLGKTSLTWFRSQGRALSVLNTVMNGVLVLTGAYVILQERLYTVADAAVAAAITALASGLLWRTNLSRLGHARLTLLAILACNLAPLVLFVTSRYACRARREARGP